MLQANKQNSRGQCTQKHIDNKFLKEETIVTSNGLEEINAHNYMASSCSQRHQDQSKIGEGGLERTHN